MKVLQAIKTRVQSFDPYEKQKQLSRLNSKIQRAAKPFVRFMKELLREAAFKVNETSNYIIENIRFSIEFTGRSKKKASDQFKVVVSDQVTVVGESNDPEAIREQIRKLEKRLAQIEAAKPSAPPPAPLLPPPPVIKDPLASLKKSRAEAAGKPKKAAKAEGTSMDHVDVLNALRNSKMFRAIQRQNED